MAKATSSASGSFGSGSGAFRRAPGLEAYDEDDLSVPPEGEDNDVLVVDFRLTVFHVNKVITRELTAHVKMGVVFYWTDPRMIGHTHPILPHSLWGPTVSLRNAVGGTSEEYEQFVVTNPDTGRMKRIVNFEAHIAVPMDLHRFPFDVQRVIPEFVSISHWRQCDLMRHGSRPSGQSYMLRPVCLPGEGQMMLMLWDGNICEWNMVAYHVNLKTEKPPGGFTVEKIRVTLILARRCKFYLIKGVGPLVILALCTFMVQRIPVQRFDARMKVWSAMFLAVFSLLNLYGSQVPPMDFLTTLDKAVYLTIAVMVWIGTEAWLADRLAQKRAWRNFSVQLDELLFFLVPPVYLMIMAQLLVWPWIKMRRELKNIDAELAEEARQQRERDSAQLTPSEKSSALTASHTSGSLLCQKYSW